MAPEAEWHLLKPETQGGGETVTIPTRLVDLSSAALHQEIDCTSGLSELLEHMLNILFLFLFKLTRLGA